MASKEINVELPQEFKPLTQQVYVMNQSARTFVCETDADYQMAGAELVEANKRLHALESLRLNITRPMDQAKKRVMDLFNPPKLLLDEAINCYKRAMRAYDDELRRKREAEQRRLDEIARKERERLEAQAAKALKKGDVDKAAAVAVKLANATPMVAAPSTPPHVRGVSQRSRWVAEVEDVVALCRAVAEGKVAPIAIEPNMTFLNQQARALREHFSIPGCVAREEQDIAASRR